MQHVVECTFFFPLFTLAPSPCSTLVRRNMGSDDTEEIAAPAEVRTGGPTSAKQVGVQRDVEVGNEGIDIDRIDRVYA